MSGHQKWHTIRHPYRGPAERARARRFAEAEGIIWRLERAAGIEDVDDLVIELPDGGRIVVTGGA